MFVDLRVEPKISNDQLVVLGMTPNEKKAFFEDKNTTRLIYKILEKEENLKNLVYFWYKRMSYPPENDMDPGKLSDFRKILYIYYDLFTRNMRSDLADLRDLETSFEDVDKITISEINDMRNYYIELTWKLNILLRFDHITALRVKNLLFNEMSDFIGLGELASNELDKVAEYRYKLKKSLSKFPDLLVQESHFKHNIISEVKGKKNLEAIVENNPKASVIIPKAQVFCGIAIDHHISLIATIKFARDDISSLFKALRSYVQDKDQKLIDDIILKLEKVKERNIEAEIPQAYHVLRLILADRPLNFEEYQFIPDFSTGFASMLMRGVFDPLRPSILKNAHFLFPEKANVLAPQDQEGAGLETHEKPFATIARKGVDDGKLSSVWRPSMMMLLDILRSQVLGLGNGIEDQDHPGASDLKVKVRAILERELYNPENVVKIFLSESKKSTKLMRVHFIESLYPLVDSVEPAMVKEYVNKLGDILDVYETIEFFEHIKNRAAKEKVKDRDLTFAIDNTPGEEFAKGIRKEFHELESDDDEEETDEDWDQDDSESEPEDDEVKDAELMRQSRTASFKNLKVKADGTSVSKELSAEDILRSGRLTKSYITPTTSPGGPIKKSELTDVVVMMIEKDSYENINSLVTQMGPGLDQFMALDDCDIEQEIVDGVDVTQRAVSIYEAIILGAIVNIVNKKNYRLLCVIQELSSDRLFQTDIFTALHLANNYTTFIDSIKSNYRRIINFNDLEEKSYFEKPQMKHILLQAAAIPTVKDPSWELLTFYRIFAKWQVNSFSEVADILERYLHATKHFVKEEEAARDLFYFHREKELLLKNLQQRMSFMHRNIAFYDTHSKEGNAVWERLIETDNGFLGKLVMDCLIDDGYDEISEKLKHLKSEEDLEALFRRVQLEIFGADAVPLSNFTLPRLKQAAGIVTSFCGYALKYHEMDNYSGTPTKPPQYEKYLSELLAWIENREKTLGDSLYYDKYYSMVKEEIENPSTVFNMGSQDPWDTFYAWDYQKDINAYGVLLPEFAFYLANKSMDLPRSKLLTAMTDDRTVVKGFLENFERGRLERPAIFLAAHPEFSAKVPVGFHVSYGEILNESVKFSGAELADSISEEIAYLYKIYPNSHFSKDDLINIQKAYHYFTSLKHSVTLAVEQKDPAIIDMLRFSRHSIPQFFLKMTYKERQITIGAYFRNPCFFNLLQNNPKKLELFPKLSGRAASKKQSKEMLRQFWTLVQNESDFYPKGKEVLYLKELFLDLDYNLMRKSDPALIKLESGAIFKVFTVELKSMFNHYVLPIWQSDKVEEYTIVSFYGENTRPSDILEVAKKSSQKRGIKPLIVISFKNLSYEFREELKVGAVNDGLNLAVIDRSLSAFMLLPEMNKFKKEILHYVASVYGTYNPFDESDNELLARLFSEVISPCFELDDNLPSLLYLSKSYDLNSQIKKFFQEADSENTRYIYLDARDGTSFVKMLANVMASYGMDFDPLEEDLGVLVVNILQHSSEFQEKCIVYFDYADEIFDSLYYDRMREITLLSDILHRYNDRMHVFFGGSGPTIHYSPFALLEYEDHFSYFSSQRTAFLPSFQGITVRDYLLNPLKALGIIFPDNFSFHEFFLKFNYEITLVKEFGYNLVNMVRDKLGRDSFPPYILTDEIINSLLETLDTQKRAKDLYLSFLDYDERYKYVVYTLGYIFYDAPFQYFKITPQIVYLHMSLLFHQKLEYFDLDELKNILIELEALQIIFIFPMELSYAEFFIEGKFNFKEMLGGLDEIKRNITILRKNSEQLLPGPHSWNRRPIFKSFNEKDAERLCHYLDLSDDSPEFYKDPQIFKKDAQKFVDYPHIFTIYEEFKYLEFFMKNEILFLNPAYSAARIIFFFKELCIRHNRQFLHVYCHDADFSDYESNSLLLDKLHEFVKSNSYASLPKFIVFLDNSRCEKNNFFELIIQKTDDILTDHPIFFDAVVVPCFNFESSFNLVFNSQTEYDLDHLLFPKKWSKTSLALYLNDLGLSMDDTRRIMEDTGGFDDLILGEIMKIRGIPHHCESLVTKPFLSGDLRPLLESVLKAFPDPNKRIKLSHLVDTLEQDPVFRKQRNISVYSPVSQFLVLLEFCGLFTIEREVLDSFISSYGRINPFFASGKIFPMN
ncbi:MAG: hypothetical protein LBE27_04140 [Deltaproteobacteria bacterium]|jgi:hypothetical protein|nr:hypothetical protein [Deltaproteobacteria bacterium]